MWKRLLILVNFCMVAILKKVYEDIREVEQILQGKTVSKYKDLFFISDSFCMAAIVAAILSKKVDEDVREVDQTL